MMITVVWPEPNNAAWWKRERKTRSNFQRAAKAKPLKGRETVAESEDAAKHVSWLRCRCFSGSFSSHNSDRKHFRFCCSGEVVTKFSVSEPETVGRYPSTQAMRRSCVMTVMMTDSRGVRTNQPARPLSRFCHTESHAVSTQLFEIFLHCPCSSAMFQVTQAHSAWPSLRGRVQRWFRPQLGKKRGVLRSSGPCYQDCWHAGLLHASWIGTDLRRLKGQSGWALSRLTKQ